MTFSGNSRSYLIIEDKGRRARFSGELCVDCFAAYAYSMVWIPQDEPEDTENIIPVTDEERIEFIKEVRRFLRRHIRYCRVKFFDDKWKRFNPKF